jgi:hypothetical protein
MTLCAVWRDRDNIHFCSDSRITVSENSSADVGIKVIPIPYRIYAPSEAHVKKIDFLGELGMCFAGSALNSLFIKESLGDVLLNLQHAPTYTDVSIENIMVIIYGAYVEISKKWCATDLAGKGISKIVVAGYCPTKHVFRAYLFETDINNNHSYKEIVVSEGEHLFIGTGVDYAAREFLLVSEPTLTDKMIQTVFNTIKNSQIDSVGGALQYGRFEVYDNTYLFKTFGMLAFDSGVNYYRGGLDLNASCFSNKRDGFYISYPYLEFKPK